MNNKNTITAIFSEQAKLNPENIAIVFENEKLTYKELEDRSNQLAHFLRSKGIVEDLLVPICINRSIEMIIGILGILKAGGAYVPIDPEYPKDRIAYILTDTKGKLVITDTNSSILLKEDNIDIEIIDIEGERLSIDKLPVTPPSINLQPHNLAYIIYTSGSTGMPKGVMIEHRNLIRLFFTENPLFDFKETDVWTMFHSFCFDFSVWEMYGALLFGGRLVVIPKSVAKDAAAYADLILKENVTILNQTPSAFYLLQEHILNTAATIPLRYVIFGGEALTPSKLKTWKDRYKNCKLINMYGITETTVHVTYIELTAEHCNSSKSVIGSPIPTLYAYVLNNEQQKSPLDEEGELYIGGEGLARGYLNLPELTAYRFIKDPFSTDKDARLYRTGDLAKIMADGSLEYMGRIDDQVKINGFRIELGEIENNISAFTGIEQCVVLAQENTIGEKKLIAYIKSAQKVNKQLLLKHLQTKLPDYMVPRIFIDIDTIPLTRNGKTDKAALSKIKLVRPDLAVLYKKPKTKTEEDLSSVWAGLLEITKIGIDDNFFELGGSSLLAQKAVAEYANKFNYILPVTKLYQYPTVGGLAKFIDKKPAGNNNSVEKRTDGSNSTDIAVIGMAGRFPGADTINALWHVLMEGKETTSFFTEDELDPAIPLQLKKDPTYVKARGIIKDAEYFDPAFFGINPKLAELMDPQQRVFLEIAWEVLEKTGHLPAKYTHKIGVFAGVGTNTYYEDNVLPHTELIDNVGKMQVLSVNEKDYIASRTSYHLNLKGPGVSVNSACSTSLLAIAQAVNALRTGQCDAAIAGGASITSPIKSGHLYQEGSMLSADGHCRSFDNDSTGTVFSDGAGVVLLKKLDNAKRDGDIIYGIIKGVGINNDGYGKGSFTAPSSDGQADAISSAIIDAGIEAADITYIEAHGTGTPIGDPIEIEGLVTAFGKQDKNQYCAISSIKSNFGHLTQAAGVAGLIKVCLSLHHKKLFPSVGFKTPNKHIDFENSPFYVNDRSKDWETDKKRIAGVSSFGVGGTNVHVVLEEYENAEQLSSPGRPFELIAFSANTENSRDNYANALGNFIKDNPTTHLTDIAYSLQRTRNEFSYRRFAVADTAQNLTDILFAAPATSNINNLKELPGEIVFTFPGQGAQYLNMGADLYKQEPVYRAAIDQCAEILHQHVDIDIRTIIYPEVVSDAANDNLRNTKYTQPALFVTEYALAKLWISWGITPTLFCGHSIGEYVAAHLSGVFSLEDGLKLIALRGKMVSELPSGSMLSIREDMATVSALLPPNLSIAAVNSPKLCVVAGPDEDIAGFCKILDSKEIVNKPLFTSHAFHSSMMDPILQGFREVVDEVTFSAPLIPIISTVTTNILTNAEATSADYWVNHLRNTVQFSKAVETILTYDNPLFLEVGPGNVTATLVKQTAGFKGSASVKAIASLSNKDNEYFTILTALGQLWNNGLTPDWENFYTGQQRALVELPSYQFDRNKYWVEANRSNHLTQINVNAMVFEPIATQNHILPIEENTNTTDTFAMRKSNLTSKVKKVLEDASGIEMANVGSDTSFIEIGLDSLLLTQIAISLKRTFNLPITFRKLNEEYPTLETLVNYIEQNTEPEELSVTAAPVQANIQFNTTAATNDPMALITQQLQMLTQQVMLMQGGNNGAIANVAPVKATTLATQPKQADAELSNEDKIEIKKPFGATPKIERQSTTLDQKQVDFLKNLTTVYNNKTQKSKEYAAKSRPFMADPRVVSGFKPTTKELVYPIVINKSSGSKMWDIDGNEYIDALNGFGSNMLGYQPDVIKKAMHEQIDKGYEVGPQHELAAEVSKLICEFTNFDRSALCSTGSEAVLGCIRIARTVTGRPLIVAFTGSYHGIVDEVLVRGTKILKSFPAAAGIMPEAVQNILVLDYGTEESLAIIKERADEIAAVIVEPIQSRRPEFVPIDFLKKVREVTQETGSALIFDEVITGFRFHPGGAQAIMGIKADIASYGKVVGAGVPIGIIAGKKEYMDALDGGTWNYGDQSFPEIGVTYFAGTFVRHPLALASAKASLEYMKARGPQLQEELNAKGVYISKALNDAFEKRQLPIYVANYGSLWKIKYHEELPYSDLMFVLMRQKGIHILDSFPCFITEAMSYQDIDKIIACFTESMDEMINAGFFPQLNKPNTAFDPKAIVIDINNPPVKGAKLGKDKAGNPAWFIQHPTEDGKYLQVEVN
ncbi:MAG: amino acid adenylation domain-containing protein [Bacteroidota bacterium]